MFQRNANIKQLRKSLNNKHNSHLTDTQVERWIGGKTTTCIKELYYDVASNIESAPTANDVLNT